MLEVKDATIAVSTRVLFQGFSMIAPDGHITCVTGDAHSGKTTLLRSLLGFLPVQEGFVSVDGELLTPGSAPAFRRMMVYLPQHIQLLTHHLYPPVAPDSRAVDYAVWGMAMPDAVSLSAVEPLSADDIFLLAQQLLLSAHGKSILVADEPAAHLTPELTHRLLLLLRQKADEGMTVLVASRRAEIVSQADRLITLPSSLSQSNHPAL